MSTVSSFLHICAQQLFLRKTGKQTNLTGHTNFKTKKTKITCRKTDYTLNPQNRLHVNLFWGFAGQQGRQGELLLFLENFVVGWLNGWLAQCYCDFYTGQRQHTRDI